MKEKEERKNGREKERETEKRGATQMCVFNTSILRMKVPLLVIYISLINIRDEG